MKKEKILVQKPRATKNASNIHSAKHPPKHIYIRQDDADGGERPAVDAVCEDKMLLIEYEMELVINRQLHEEKHITQEVYRSVANMIIKDMETVQRRLDAKEHTA